MTPEQPSIDVDALMTEVRERVRRKRELGIYSDEVEAMLRTRMPSVVRPLFADERTDPIAALERSLESEPAYDPRSRRPIVGRAITIARQSAMWLLRWWIHEIVARQDRINRLVLEELRALRARSREDLERRLAALEASERTRRAIEADAVADAFDLAPPEVPTDLADVVEPLRRGGRVLAIESGLSLGWLRDVGVPVYGIEREAGAVDRLASLGIEAFVAEPELHLRTLPEASLDGIFASRLVGRVAPARLGSIVRECARVLRRGAPLVLLAPDVRTLAVGARDFWADPASLRPLTPELVEGYLRRAGFTAIELRELSGGRRDLGGSAAAGGGNEARPLERALFGNRELAIVARAAP